MENFVVQAERYHALLDSDVVIRIRPQNLLKVVPEDLFSRVPGRAKRRGRTWAGGRGGRQAGPKQKINNNQKQIDQTKKH